MILWLIMCLLGDVPSKNWSVKSTERFNEFLLLNQNILSIKPIFLFLYDIQNKHKYFSLFFIEYTIKVVRKVSSADRTISYTACCL